MSYITRTQLRRFIFLTEERINMTGERYGQAFFNVLPDNLKELVRGKDFDPFYRNTNLSKCWSFLLKGK